MIIGRERNKNLKNTVPGGGNQGDGSVDQVWFSSKHIGKAGHGSVSVTQCWE